MLTAAAMCLALNVYFEARGEGVTEQVAVAQVVMNRVEDVRFPDTVCGVVYERRQFSWYWDGKSDWPREVGAWELAQVVAVAVLDGWFWRDLTSGALYYHAPYVSPRWSVGVEPVYEDSAHLFYREIL